MNLIGRLLARIDALAASRLAPDEYADAKAFDAHLRRHFRRWLAYFAIACSAGALLAVAIWPSLSWRNAFFFSGLACINIFFLVASPWFGYRQWTRKSAALLLAIMVLTSLGGVVFGYFAAAGMQRPVDLEKMARAAAIAVLVVLALGSMLMGISRMRLREAIEKAARLEAEAERERLARQGAQAELKVLQAQVEPHFLFNTLASVRYLVQSGSADALPMLDHVIQYLRSALPEIRTETSTLGREVRLARSYLAIMRMRVGPRLEVAIDVPGDLEHAPFPPLMLMTLVENAVKHAVVPRGGGRIHVRARRADERLRVIVGDDGPGVGGAIGKGVGLANTRERLRALYGDAASLEIASGQGGGTVAAIEVPLP
jgi:signal transduction histidine kinase